ncbi:4957_t:CDS:2 [Ambispora leptoticha]|uniref:4957_t:CDS:1 n=1 Tax=Ambispora leptoticha TaxID=144679 RepID=A0A9N9F5M8_9GLOM|nr:4957_t:CDS:2 [Ambispora leptoticha]
MNPSTTLEFMKSCAESSAACINCAQNMRDEGCAQQCRTNAALADCAEKLIALNAPQAINVAQLTIESAKHCNEICCQHQNEHCQACSQAAKNLAESLTHYQTLIKGTH